MSALNFARQAFGREKPYSSITDWVDILTAIGIQEEAYDGIPELVDSINLQASGPAEAARAIRKKLKHGNAHQQYRGLVLLKALVENCGQKFQNTFGDGHLTDALKFIASDAGVDRRVKKKLSLVLGSWKEQYKDDPSMSVVAGLYGVCIGEHARLRREVGAIIGVDTDADDKKRREKVAKQRAKLEERARREQAALKHEAAKNKPKRVPFNFEQEKPKVLASIVEASQASSNLHNAITLVNLATDDLQTNERVQECLAKAKAARKPVVRYIQLVENEDVIGTLIETNDRIMSALELYQNLRGAKVTDGNEIAAVTSRMAAARISPEPTLEYNPDGRNGKARGDTPGHLHPDLEDLSFGALGNSSNNLPPPMRPHTRQDDVYDEEVPGNRGSLSDFSDYDSSDEETHKAAAGSSSKRGFVTVSDDEDNIGRPSASGTSKSKNYVEDDDPFADPFADRD